MTFLFLVLFLLLPAPYPTSRSLVLLQKQHSWKNKQKHFACIGTRYITLKPLAFNEGVHRENLMKGQGKLKEDAVIIVYGASCSAISSLSDSNYRVCTLGCKTLQEHKAPGCFMLHLYPFSVHLLKLFVPFIDRSWSKPRYFHFQFKSMLRRKISHSSLQPKLGCSFGSLNHFHVWLSFCFSL